MFACENTLKLPVNHDFDIVCDFVLSSANIWWTKHGAEIEKMLHAAVILSNSVPVPDSVVLELRKKSLEPLMQEAELIANQVVRVTTIEHGFISGNGLAGAYYCLAWRRENGMGLSQDMPKAMFWYKHSAEAGNVEAKARI